MSKYPKSLDSVEKNFKEDVLNRHIEGEVGKSIKSIENRIKQDTKLPSLTNHSMTESELRMEGRARQMMQ
jgi:hypothetical protein